jgi:hypothetical protein
MIQAMAQNTTTDPTIDTTAIPLHQVAAMQSQTALAAAHH